MGFLSDILLAGGAFGAAIFCMVLSRRLKALTGLDSGMGAAIAVLSAQVDDLNRALAGAQAAAQGASGQLGQQTERAEAACRRLELLIAALHDLPEADPPPAAGRKPAAPEPRPVARAMAAAPERTLERTSERAPEHEPDYPAPRARILRRRSPEAVA